MMLPEETRMLHFVFVKPDNLLAIDYVFSTVSFLSCYFLVHLFNYLFDDLLVYPNKFEKGHGRCVYVVMTPVAMQIGRKYLSVSALIL